MPRRGLLRQRAFTLLPFGDTLLPMNVSTPDQMHCPVAVEAMKRGQGRTDRRG